MTGKKQSVRRRRNPREGSIVWTFGAASLGELKLAGADGVTLPVIVKSQALEDQGEYGIVGVYDDQDGVLIVAAVGHGMSAEVLNDVDGVYELAEKLLALHRAGRLDPKITLPLRRNMTFHKREARMYARRAGAKLREHGGIGSVEYEALNRMYAAGVAELIAIGFARSAGW